MTDNGLILTLAYGSAAGAAICLAIASARRRLRAAAALCDSICQPAEQLDDDELEHFRRVAALVNDAPLIPTRPVGEDKWARHMNKQIKRTARRRT